VYERERAEDRVEYLCGGGGCTSEYGVALVSRINKIIGLFCKRAL